MTPKEFKQRLATARSRHEVETLLGLWFSVTGTFEELRELRDAVIARLDKLTEDGTPTGARGGAFVPAEAA